MATVDLPKPDVPGAVAVVRDFVNTADHETGVDDLAAPTDLARYLRSAGLCARSVRHPRPRPPVGGTGRGEGARRRCGPGDSPCSARRAPPGARGKSRRHLD